MTTTKTQTAPQVTPADVEATIASEHYFTGQDGANGAHVRATNGDMSHSTRDPLCGVQFCVLVLKNSHIVTGEALLQDLSKPDPERARASARRRAFDKAYDMVVYAERDRLSAPAASATAAIARQFIDFNRVSCPEATTNDRVYENAPMLVEQLADVVGYYKRPEDAA